MIWIVTDSAQEYERDPERGFEVIDLPMLLNGKPMKGKMEDSEFYDCLADSNCELKTSQPSPAVLESVFSDLTATGDEVIAILVSSTLSGTFNSARLAAADLNGVYLVDSHQACLSQSALVAYALQLRDEGKSSSEIVENLEEAKKRVKLLAVLPSLAQLKKGGRISPLKAAAADLANIKPVLTIDDNGDVDVCGKTRGMKKAIHQCAKLAVESGIDLSMPVVLAISGPDSGSAELLRKNLEEELEAATGEKVTIDAPVHPLSRMLTIHTGVGGTGAGFFCKEKSE